jgi:hypothetical protein
MLFSFIVTRHFKASRAAADVMSVTMSKLIIVIRNIIKFIVGGSEC